MNVYTVEEMRERDRNTMIQHNMDILTLVDRATDEILDVLVSSICPQPEGKQFLVVCGKGNNGADGLSLAGKLKNLGSRVVAIMIQPQEFWSEEVRTLAHSLGEVFIWDEVSVERWDEWVAGSRYIVDAILGTGCRGEMEPAVAAAIAQINETGLPVISLDLPSGIRGNNGQACEIAIKATYTIVVDGYKTGNLMGSSSVYSGELLLTKEVGLWTSSNPDYKKTMLERNQQKLPSRSKAAHKYDFGKLVVIGGSRGMEGAGFLAAMAGLRTGCGVSQLLSCENWEARKMSFYPELMVDTFFDHQGLMEKLKKTNAVVFGPGTVYVERDVEYVQEIMESDIPLVLDGGAIPLLNDLRDRIQLSKHRLIVTPHTGEMARLFRVTSRDVLEDPVYFITSFLESYQVDLVMKGPCTVIASGQEMFFSYGPNSGMATAGSGDVLSGLIGGFLAQGCSNEEAMKSGVLVHQEAGNAARKIYGERSMTSTDILSNIYKGIHGLEQTIAEDVKG
ncbi:NAD(P)H-hydrate dehydratase [Alkalibacter rhizosphaerae]|uniref:Bifunctional NAD(P)H-hydrate repair enzyme n=1 Tax=Alkalibacter rhizosphaerae TaxID=2815577 RepID=A0A974XLR5_9FIRM|nr:NAD(P)H-hydrate dehydratase [Alkalibacter rhizosphaerae]QSX08281.1 NAD(P)H-hydrate dehydratase [Alkalibacter rhizosphaerae]